MAIVDDDASVCRAMKRLVRAHGMEGECFSSGQELLEQLARLPAFHPDCVVLDLQMPGMDGLEVQQRLKFRQFPVIFITAHDESAARERALAAGAVGFMRKPFDDDTFIRTLRSALEPAVRAERR